MKRAGRTRALQSLGNSAVGVETQERELRSRTREKSGSRIHRGSDVSCPYIGNLEGIWIGRTF